MPLFRAEIVLLSSRKLTSPSKRSISAREAANLPIVYYNEAVLNAIIDDFFGNEKLKSPVRLHTTNTERLIQYLQSGDYATFTDGFSRLLSRDAMEEKRGRAIFVLKSTHMLVNLLNKDLMPARR